jgi:hypothetical protein
MLFHMLRLELGDKRFLQALHEFYRQYRFRAARFADLEKAFAATAGRDLSETFNQWVQRTGAPQLKVSGADVSREGNEYRLRVLIEQTQPGQAYRLSIPLTVTLEGRQQAYQTTVTMDEKHLALTRRLPAYPLRLDVDPEFDLFRRLDSRERPPALSGLFGADKVLIALATDAPEALKQGYRALAEAWQRSRPEDVEFRLDRDIEALPADRAVWLFGWENRLRPQLVSALVGHDVAIGASGVRIGVETLPRQGHSVVIAARHPADRELTLSWLASDNPAALPGLARKLPHYSQYSYLGFTGDEPTNVAKGRWKVADSPTTVYLTAADGSAKQVARAQLATRRPLVLSASVFSK